MVRRHAKPDRETKRLKSQRRRNVVHDFVRSVSHVAPSLHGPARHPARHRDRRSQSRADRKPHRLLYQQRRVAHRLVRQSEFSPIAAPRARSRARCLRTSGRAFRKTRRGVATGTRSEPAAILSGDVQLAGLPTRGTGGGGSDDYAARLRQPDTLRSRVSLMGRA